MGLETGTWIEDLDETNPVHATDQVDEGDDHIRLTKKVLKNQFTSLGSVAVTRTAAAINDLATLTGTETLTNKDLTAPTINTVAAYGMVILDDPEVLASYTLGTLPTSAAWTSTSGLASTTLSSASAIAAIVRVTCRMGWTSGTDKSVSIGIRKAGSSVTTQEIYIARARQNTASSAANIQVQPTGEGLVKLDASLDFEFSITYSSSPVSVSENFEVSLIGYYV